MSPRLDSSDLMRNATMLNFDRLNKLSRQATQSWSVISPILQEWAVHTQAAKELSAYTQEAQVLQPSWELYQNLLQEYQNVTQTNGTTSLSSTELSQIIESPNSSSQPPVGLWNDGRLDLKQYEQFISLLRQDIFEPDAFCESELFFLQLFQEDRLLALEYLNRAFADHISEDHILEGLLHILSAMEYEEVYPNGQILVQAIASTHSPILQDLIIRCYEHWGNSDGVRFLRTVIPLSEELSEYIRQVSLDLEGSSQ